MDEQENKEQENTIQTPIVEETESEKQAVALVEENDSGATTKETVVEETETLPKKKAKKKKRKEEPLDTETTFADMNVEGFSWYNPKKKNGKEEKMNVSKKEYWAMVRGAFAAMLPMIVCMIAAMGIIFVLAYLWLR